MLVPWRVIFLNPPPVYNLTCMIQNNRRRFPPGFRPPPKKSRHGRGVVSASCFCQALEVPWDREKKTWNNVNPLIQKRNIWDDSNYCYKSILYMFSKKGIHFNKVFHYFHHPFLGYPYFWKDPCMARNPPFFNWFLLEPVTFLYHPKDWPPSIHLWSWSWTSKLWSAVFPIPLANYERNPVMIACW